MVWACLLVVLACVESAEVGDPCEVTDEVSLLNAVEALDTDVDEGSDTTDVDEGRREPVPSVPDEDGIEVLEVSMLVTGGVGDGVIVVEDETLVEKAVARGVDDEVAIAVVTCDEGTPEDTEWC